MKQKILKNTLFILAIATFYSFNLPDGWTKKGSEPEFYDMGIDVGAGQNGKNAATIKSLLKDNTGFGTLMQSCLAEKYHGKRVKMTGYVKSKNVEGWAGLWLRIDAAVDQSKPLGFDNMGDRPIKGTTDWKKYEITMDVPSTAFNLSYGALLDGEGQIWFTDINFEVVDNSVSVTRRDCHVCSEVLKEPTNLKFEK